jgi:uncharacterized protein with PIN domain
MSVLCPGCGREYDVSLFEFGHAVDCDCGARVSLQTGTTQLRNPRDAQGPRFIADAMLGRLARWLRLIGVDTAYEAHVEDRRLADRGKLEGRVVLTRDALLPRRFKDTPCLLIRSEVVAEQLAQVVAAFDIDWGAAAFSRCTRCNTPVGRLTREEAAGRVPPRVLLEQERFVGCPSCRRVYWRGSHVERMRAALERALGRGSEVGEVERRRQ